MESYPGQGQTNLQFPLTSTPLRFSGFTPGVQVPSKRGIIFVTMTVSLAGYLLARSLMVLTPPTDPDEMDRLLRAAARGDQVALQSLLERHRERLRRMVALRLDSRFAARVDASDVVQEALIDATRKLVDYERDRPLPFYPWLHRLTTERLAAVHRKHRAGPRSVGREEQALAWPDNSAWLLVNQLVTLDSTPGQVAVREESRQQVHAALERLTPPDREVLVMRYLEDLTFPEIAAILAISESAAKMRHLRAIERIRSVLNVDDSGSVP
jgi:RNA polymerase sigma-70 factor (ECF subfamily)